MKKLIAIFCGLTIVAMCILALPSCKGPSETRVSAPDKRINKGEYINELVEIKRPLPILADYPDFVAPVTGEKRFSSPPLILDEDADLFVRAWRYSYNARGIIEIPNKLNSKHVALITVHPWGIDDGQGWQTPEPAGVAFFCTPQKHEIYRKHIRQVINPLLRRLRNKVALVGFSLPGDEDPIRKLLYPSITHGTDQLNQELGRKLLAEKLGKHEYTGDPIISRLPLPSNDRQTAAGYFKEFPGLDASAKYNGSDFWSLPIPINSMIDMEDSDIVFYDEQGYAAVRDYLKEKGIKHILLAGYSADGCVATTTCGYRNLMKDFNIFIVGDATLALFPASSSPTYATNTAVSKASLSQLITQTSWIEYISPH